MTSEVSRYVVPLAADFDCLLAVAGRIVDLTFDIPRCASGARLQKTNSCCVQIATDAQNP
jgi:hypothetical protein